MIITDPYIDAREDAEAIANNIWVSLNNLVSLLHGQLRCHVELDIDYEFGNEGVPAGEYIVAEIAKIHNNNSLYLPISLKSIAVDEIMAHLAILYEFVAASPNNILHNYIDNTEYNDDEDGLFDPNEGASLDNVCCSMAFIQLLLDYNISYTPSKKDISIYNQPRLYEYPRLASAYTYAIAKLRLVKESEIDATSLALLANITNMGVIQAINRGNLVGEKKYGKWVIPTNHALQWLIDRK